MANWEYGLSYRDAVILVAVLILTGLVRRRFFSPLSDIPGPFVASITRLWHVRAVLSGKQTTTILELHRKHGDYVRISHDEVSVSHPDAVKQLLRNPLPKGPWYKLMAWPDWRFQTPMSTLEPKAKQERSRWLASGYLNSNVIQSEDAISGQIERLKYWLDRYAQSGEPMHIDKFLTYCAFDIVGEAMFSKAFGFSEEGEDIDGSIANMLSINQLVAWGAWYRPLFDVLLKNPLMTWLDILPTSHLLKISQAALVERRDSKEARYDVVEHWLQNHRKHPDKISFRDIQAVTNTNVGAGSDTISCSLQSLIYHMVRLPGAWERAQAEILDAQRFRGICKDLIVSFADAQQLPYLQACIREALRVFPPAPMGLVRRVRAGGLTIGNRTFPKGVLLSVSAYTIHHSKQIWGDDADSFRPDRWLEPGAEDKEQYFIPWGAGMNSCPGQHLARIEVWKMAATIVRDYKIRQVDPRHQWKWAAYFAVVPHSWPCFVERVTT